MTPQFQKATEAVATKLAELLCASTSVIDSAGTVVAVSEPNTAGVSYDLLKRSRETTFLRVPLHISGQAGEVIVGEPLNGELIPTRLAEALVQLVINQADLPQLPKQHELKNTFIHDLLHGQLKDEEQILRDAKLLGMDFVPPRAVILIDATDYILGPPDDGRQEATDAQVRRRAQFVIGSVVSFFHLPNDTICAYMGNGEVAVLKASNTKNLARWVERSSTADHASPSWANLAALRRAGHDLLNHLQSDTGVMLKIGIGRHHPGVCGLALSYQDAVAALSLGRRFQAHQQVHCLDGLGIAAFIGVADERTKIEIATHLLSPLDHEPELLATLDAFFTEDCRPSETVERLSIHRNTLNYRLGKIKSLCGLDPRRFDEAVQIRLALLVRALGNVAK